MRVLRADGRRRPSALDVLPSPYTDVVGSIADRERRARARCAGADAVLHAATLHKPHVGSHGRQEFVDDQRHRHAEPARGGRRRRRRPRSCSRARRARSAARSTPPPGAPAAWITEDVAPVPRNVYGVTKAAAEDLCELVHRDHGLPCLILRTSRFFPEARRPRRRARRLRGRQRQGQRAAVPPRRHRGRRRAPTGCALERAPRDRLRPLHRQRDHAVHAATTWPSCAPTRPRSCAGASPASRRSTRARGWRMFASIDRVYVNDARARASSAGRRARTSRTRSTASRPARSRAATSRRRSARRATTPSRRGPTRRARGRRPASAGRRARAPRRRGASGCRSPGRPGTARSPRCAGRRACAVPARG